MLMLPMDKVCILCMGLHVEKLGTTLLQQQKSHVLR